jgi:hypothetical protein
MRKLKVREGKGGTGGARDQAAINGSIYSNPSPGSNSLSFYTISHLRLFSWS